MKPPGSIVSRVIEIQNIDCNRENIHNTCILVEFDYQNFLQESCTSLRFKEKCGKALFWH